MATHSRILAWEIPGTEEPGNHSPWGPRESEMTEATQHTRQGDGEGRGGLAGCSPGGRKRVGHDWVTEQYYLGSHGLWTPLQ